MPDTADLRNKTRRVKNHILNRFLDMADKVDKGEALGKDVQLYSDLMMTFAKSVLPRTQEISGEDGGAVTIKLLQFGTDDTLQLDAGTPPITDTSEQS